MGFINGRKIIKVGLINLLLLVAILSLVEGLSSILLLFYRINKVQPIAEIRHTQYEQLLGWINLPNVNLPNMYGEGM